MAHGCRPRPMLDNPYAVTPRVDPSRPHVTITGTAFAVGALGLLGLDVTPAASDSLGDVGRGCFGLDSIGSMDSSIGSGGADGPPSAWSGSGSDDLTHPGAGTFTSPVIRTDPLPGAGPAPTPDTSSLSTASTESVDTGEADVFAGVLPVPPEAEPADAPLHPVLMAPLAPDPDGSESGVEASASDSSTPSGRIGEFTGGDGDGTDLPPVSDGAAPWAIYYEYQPAPAGSGAVGDFVQIAEGEETSGRPVVRSCVSSRAR